MNGVEAMIPVFLTLAVAGAFAGLLAGLFGVGGGIIVVPVLFFVFQLQGIPTESAMIIATATSLATIIPTAISSLRAHNKRANADMALLVRWIPLVLIGVLLGSYLITRIDGRWLAVLFAIVAIVSALDMLFRAKPFTFASQLPGLVGQALMGIIIGLVSTLIGIGGGVMTVPILTAYGYSPHRAVGTSSGVGLLIALPAAITLLFVSTPKDAPPLTIGLVNLLGFANIVPLTVLFAPLGAKLASKLDPAVLKKLFAIVLCITGIRMLVQVLG